MGINMIPAEVYAAAKKNDQATADALKAAQEAVKSLSELKGYVIFGLSPAGEHTDGVFGRTSKVMDDLIAEVNKAIDVLNQNLTTSVDNVVNGQEVAEVDYVKMERDNKSNSSKLDTTGIKPGEENYQAPTAGGGSTPTTAPPTGTGPGTTAPSNDSTPSNAAVE